MRHASSAPSPQSSRLGVARFVYGVCLVLLGVLSPSLGPNVAAQYCGGCPQYCGLSECSCGQFDCGSAEFCSIVGNADPCLYPTGCPTGQIYYDGCCATTGSPILIDLAHNGFDLTNMSAGVKFAIGPTNFVYQVAWTEPGTDDAWLVLDRNGNGRIDNGVELFGNHTPQPDPPKGEQKNGYRALSVFDGHAEGGNEDGEITPADRVFASLRLWRDGNHNGQSEPGELLTLDSAGIVSISLDYRESKRRDEFGNVFQFRSRVSLILNGRMSQTESVDVFLRLMGGLT
jgi:hypothetical protein